MPTYEYRCENDHTFDVMQRMSDDPVSTCEVCGAPVQRVFHPIAVHFKGSGFYNTDYGTRKRSREKEAAESAKSDGAKSDGAKDGSTKTASGTDSGSSTSDKSSNSGSGSGTSATKTSTAD
ncbi:MAG: FmdB family zinc ribbon protein [Solirubrobacteraceae bacterium]